MAGDAILCPKCKTALPLSASPDAGFSRCPDCNAEAQAFAFPALFRALPSGNVGQTIVTEGEASCFYHPQKRSVVPCSACGRFLCALCDVELDGQHLCPGCVETAQRKGKMTSLEHRRSLYDNMALGLALLPLLAWPITIVTAPAAVICGIVWWKKPTSILPRSRIRLIFAITIGLLQMIGWGVGITLAFQNV